LNNLAPILVIEDDVLTSMMIVGGLEDAGFSVVAASVAEAAMRLLTAGAFCALVTDVNFAPGAMTGWDIARHMRTHVGDVPVVYTSGTSGHEWSVNGVANSQLVRKPFSTKQIVSLIVQLVQPER
jgi:CheY-like chemotaxis protein